MPSLYELLPSPGTRPLAALDGKLLDDDLHDPATWERYGWGAFAPARRRSGEIEEGLPASAEFRAFVSARCSARGPSTAPSRARPSGPAPSPWCCWAATACPPWRGPWWAGGPARRRASTPGQGGGALHVRGRRRSRDSRQHARQPPARRRVERHGQRLARGRQAVFGEADHHGIYGEATFQGNLLRRLLRPVHRQSPAAGEG